MAQPHVIYEGEAREVVYEMQGKRCRQERRRRIVVVCDKVSIGKLEVGVSTRFQSKRVRNCGRIRNKEIINGVYSHARPNTGLCGLFIIRCRCFDAQLKSRLTPGKRDELSAAAGYASSI